MGLTKTERGPVGVAEDVGGSRRVVRMEWCDRRVVRDRESLSSWVSEGRDGGETKSSEGWLVWEVVVVAKD